MKKSMKLKIFGENIYILSQHIFILVLRLKKQLIKIILSELIEWESCEDKENLYYKGKMRKHFPTTMTNELDKMSLIPRHIRELLKDFIKVSRQVIKTSETINTSGIR